MVFACRKSAAVLFLSQAGGVQRGRCGGVVPAGGARGGGLGDRRLLLYPDRQDDVFRRSRARLRGERQRDRERADRRDRTGDLARRLSGDSGAHRLVDDRSAGAVLTPPIRTIAAPGSTHAALISFTRAGAAEGLWPRAE